jgi:hypothetical protein
METAFVISRAESTSSNTHSDASFRDFGNGPKGLETGPIKYEDVIAQRTSQYTNGVVRLRLAEIHHTGLREFRCKKPR